MRAMSVLVLLVVLGGCASPWEQYYEPAHQGLRYKPTRKAQVRFVEPSRIERFEQEERARQSYASVAVEDLPPHEQLAKKNRALEALQLTERGDEATIIGWSMFTSFKPVDPYAGNLEAFARSRGAHYVVVAEQDAGKAERIVSAPVPSYGFSSGQATAYGSNGYSAIAYGSAFTTSTTYVPVVVSHDQRLYRAFFVRRTPDKVGDQRAR